MQVGGEAADQVVKMRLEGAEFAIRVAGEGATRIMAILVSVLREENKTRGKARLDSMLRSGKELKVFTVKNSDLKKFTQEAKKYGVEFISYADSSGGVNILGPKMAEAVVEGFTYEYLKKVGEDESQKRIAYEISVSKIEYLE